jgi:hypothetical protein
MRSRFRQFFDRFQGRGDFRVFSQGSLEKSEATAGLNAHALLGRFGGRG